MTFRLSRAEVELLKLSERVLEEAEKAYRARLALILEEHGVAPGARGVFKKLPGGVIEYLGEEEVMPKT